MPAAFYDVHLMISHPLQYAEPFIKAGASLYNFHLECEDDIQQTIDAVKALGCKVGLTIKPGTDPEALAPYLDQLDLVLVMSVEPGFGGQKFMPSALDKLRWLKAEREARGLSYLLEVDGGVDAATAPQCVAAGADVLVAGSAALSAWMGFEADGGAVVGTLPAGLPAFYMPQMLPWSTFSQLLLPAMVITLMSFLETASSAKVENQRGGTQWNENQDLIGQGLAKMASGFSGAFPTSASFSRSAINLYAGARTGWASLFATLVVLVVLLWLTPALHHVPQAVLAAVVIAAVVSLVRPQVLLRLWRVSRVEALTGGATFVLTLATAPRLYWGVLAGLLISLSHFLYQRLHPRIIEVGLHPDGSLRDRHLWHLPPLAPQLYALRMDAELDFASASALERAVVDHMARNPAVKHVCLFAQPINRMDVTGVETFGKIHQFLRERGATLHVSGLKLPVDHMLRRAGELSPSPTLHLYRTDLEALAALQMLNQQDTEYHI